MVSTLSRPKAAGQFWGGAFPICEFQHSAARRRLQIDLRDNPYKQRFQHSAARRRLNRYWEKKCQLNCFNTQPPEGGCNPYKVRKTETAVSTLSRPKAAGRMAEWAQSITVVSTLSRPKAAVVGILRSKSSSKFQHSAARRRLLLGNVAQMFQISVSTLSRPKAADTAKLFFNIN